MLNSSRRMFGKAVLCSVLIAEMVVQGNIEVLLTEFRPIASELLASLKHSFRKLFNENGLAT